MWATQWGGASTWPYMRVEELGISSEWAVLTISSQVSAGSLPFVSTHRTSSSTISAPRPPPDLVVEDLGGRPRDRAEASALALLQELPEGDPKTGGAVQDLHRAEGVDVDVGDLGLDDVEDPEVEVARQARVKPALD